MKTSSLILFPNWFICISKFQILALLLASVIFGCSKAEGVEVTEEMLVSETTLCLVLVDSVFQEMELEQAPQYINGEWDGFIGAISANISYPAEARENGIEGSCSVNFEITKEGTVENIEAVEDPGGGIGEKTVEVIELITEGVSYSPAILDGNPVRVRKNISLGFKLQG